MLSSGAAEYVGLESKYHDLVQAFVLAVHMLIHHEVVEKDLIK